MNTGADVQATFVATLVDEWVLGGVTEAVICPGSRSTPLTAALAACAAIRTHVVLDERSAGFVALGLSRAQGRPCLVVTSSGTAAVELHPAVVEAHHSAIPILVLTADRPFELQQVGAAQTTAQTDLYPGATRWSAVPGLADSGSSSMWRSLAARALAEATGSSGRPPGPVHINLAFREPLTGTPGALPRPRTDSAGSSIPWHQVHRPAAVKDFQVPPELLVTEGLIVAGDGSPDPRTLVRLAEHLSWPLLADPLSGSRAADSGSVVSCADALLRAPLMAGLRPQVVLRFGRPSASKVQAQWLASLDCPQLLVDPQGGWADPDRLASTVLDCRGEDLMAGLLAPAPRETTPWIQLWARAEAAAREVIGRTLKTDRTLSEPALAAAVVAAATPGSVLIVASSMPVRDVEWFSPPRSGLRVISNRGVNGIDGTLATAVGVALSGVAVTVLIGDLAYLYDVSSLLGAAGRGISLNVVVVDNQGGGIFSFLPQAQLLDDAVFEEFWGTPQQADLLALGTAYGARAERLESLDQLEKVLADPQPGIRVLVAESDRRTNVEVHRELNRAVVDAVELLGAG